ncbi:MAG: hypothetical protein GEV11_06770 [Streptosporangiales bacterium]|nr:hypothetical protein [Streptosporangiales bacterium]
MPDFFDVHVHSAPSGRPRSADDLTAARNLAAAGYAGGVLKEHCELTVGRAVAASAATGLSIYGGVVLNAPVGGINPYAVESCLHLGGRVVWMPTVDAHAQRSSGWEHPVVCTPTSPEAAYALPPVEGALEKHARRILDLVAAADAVIATGHIGAEEVGWLVTAAREHGVRRVLLTHPGLIVPGLSASRTRELTELGAYAEITSLQYTSGGHSAEELAAFITEVGPQRCVLSSDAGAAGAPGHVEGLAALMEALTAAGLDPGAVQAMAGENPYALVAP